jgi:XTP/dITP diphosphohydrolase
MLKLLLASNNRDKIIEIQALLEGMDIQLTTPTDLGLDLLVEENAESYAENAAQKAASFGKATGLVSLADDSGLEVDVLGGLPGVRSHRFSPKPGATDADRRLYLLERLKGTPRPWKAHFHCTVAIYDPSGETFFAEGNCYGEIIPEERGSHGFGYDPIFLVPEFGQTMAELSLEQKNRLSHRAMAIRSALPILIRYI